MTPDIRELGILSLKEKHDDKRRVVLKTIVSLENSKSSRKEQISVFLVFHEVEPKKGNTTKNSFFGHSSEWSTFLRYLVEDLEHALVDEFRGVSVFRQDPLQLLDLFV